MAHSLQDLGIYEYHFVNRRFCFLYNKVVRKIIQPRISFYFFNVFCIILFSQVLVKSNRRAVRFLYCGMNVLQNHLQDSSLYVKNPSNDREMSF